MDPEVIKANLDLMVVLVNLVWLVRKVFLALLDLGANKGYLVFLDSLDPRVTKVWMDCLVYLDFLV